MSFKISPYVFPGIKKKFLPVSNKTYKRTRISPEEVMKIVAENCAVTVEEILSRNRKSEVVDARHIFCRIMKKELHYPYTKIGEIVNGRDHTTAMHSVTTCGDRCKNESGYNEHYNFIVDLIHNKI